MDLYRILIVYRESSSFTPASPPHLRAPSVWTAKLQRPQIKVSTSKPPFYICKGARHETFLACGEFRHLVATPAAR